MPLGEAGIINTQGRGCAFWVSQDPSGINRVMLKL